jgi:hypothetical protein
MEHNFAISPATFGEAWDKDRGVECVIECDSEWEFMEETREGLVGLLPEDMIILVCRISFRYTQRIGVGFRCSSELSLASINPSEFHLCKIGNQ